MERGKSFRDYKKEKTWTIKLGVLNKTSSKKSREKDTLKKQKSPKISKCYRNIRLQKIKI